MTDKPDYRTSTVEGAAGYERTRTAFDTADTDRPVRTNPCQGTAAVRKHLVALETLERRDINVTIRIVNHTMVFEVPWSDWETARSVLRLRVTDTTQLDTVVIHSATSHVYPSLVVQTVERTLGGLSGG